MTTGKNFRMAFCIPPNTFKFLVGASKTVQLTYFKQSKKNGYEELRSQVMMKG